jgi:hypothetical protein
VSRMSRYVAAPLIVAMSSGHSDITRFRPLVTNRDRKSFGSCKPQIIQNWQIPLLRLSLEAESCYMKKHGQTDMVKL